MKSPTAMSQKIIQIQIIKNFRLDIWVEEPKPQKIPKNINQKIPKYKLISFLFSHKSNQNFILLPEESKRERKKCTVQPTQKSDKNRNHCQTSQMTCESKEEQTGWEEIYLSSGLRIYANPRAKTKSGSGLWFPKSLLIRYWRQGCRQERFRGES